MDQRKMILIVDDEPYILRVLRMKMERGGYEVCTALNGLDALKKIERETPSVIITDINMPHMNGRELCEIVRESQRHNRLLLIVITSDIDRANRDWTEQLENARFVEKPFSPRKILKIIDDFFLELQEA